MGRVFAKLESDDIFFIPNWCGISSVGRASACQAEGRQFESGIPLQNILGIKIPSVHKRNIVTMKILENKRHGFTVDLTIEVPAEAIDNGLEKAFRQLSKSARIPGFRKGKIPRGLFEKHYGTDVLVQESLPDVINHSYTTAVSQLDLPVVDFPKNVQIPPYEPGVCLVFTCSVDVEPEVKLGKYKGLKATRTSDKAPATKMDEQLQELRENYADYISGEHPAQDQDILLCNVKATVDGELVQAWSRDNVGVKLGAGYFGEEFDKALLGLQKETDTSFSASFAEDFYQKDVAGKTVQFDVHVVEVRQKTLPELDDAFAEKAGQLSTIDALRDRIRENLDAQAKQESEEKLRADLMEAIIQDMTVDIPAAMIEREMDHSLSQFQTSMERQSYMKFDQYLQATGKTKEAIREEFRDSATTRVKSELALKAIAKKESVTVSDADLDMQIKEWNVPEIQSLEDYKKHPKADTLENLTFMVKQKKIFDFIIAQSKISV